jgi:hypothetical protein
VSQPDGCWLTVPLSKPSLKKAPPDEDELELLDDELELLLDDEELLEDELELLLDEEEELLDEELELLLDEEELLEDEVSVPLQVGRTKLPSFVPWKPKEALCPWLRLPFQLQQLVNDGVAVLPPSTVTFQLPVTLAGWLKPSVTVQPLIEPGPSLVTVTSSWYPPFQVLVGDTVQLYVPKA